MFGFRDAVIKLGKKKGMKAALITPYGTHELVESTTRTNKQVALVRLILYHSLGRDQDGESSISSTLSKYS
jgi:hypothetical protein